MKVQKFPRVCVGVLVENSKGQILLVRSHKWQNKWICIGGKLDYGETLEECAKREAREETGLAIFDVKFIDVQDGIFPIEYYKKRHFVFVDFAAKTKSMEVTLNDEAEAYRWVSSRNALRMKLGTPTRIFIQRYIRLFARIGE